MRCLREWTGTWKDNVLTAEEERISGLVPNDSNEPTVVEESTLIVTVEPIAETTEEISVPEIYPDETPEPSDTESKEATPPPEEPIPRATPINAGPVPVHTSDSAQFLPSPVSLNWH